VITLNKLDIFKIVVIKINFTYAYLLQNSKCGKFFNKGVSNMEQKQTKLKLTKGFKVASSRESEKSVVCSGRSQCRTTHKRKDC